MRFRFTDDRNLHEKEEREAALHRIDEWWAAFASHADRVDGCFSRGLKFDVPQFMGQLSAVDERLMWEFGPPLKGGKHRLVFTPERDRFLWPLVETLLARAPVGTGFEFYTGRLAAPLETASRVVMGRTAISLDGWTVMLSSNEDFGVDLTFLVPKAVAGLEGVRAAAFVAAETLLGEHLMDTFVDAIEVESTSPPGAKLNALGKLPAEFTSLLGRHRLPAQTMLESMSERKHFVLELTPEEKSDYRRQDDLLVGTTAFLPMWQRAHSDLPFASERFSRCGETFCYLKMDGSEGLDPQGFADRGEIQDALENALAKDLGAVIGGGTGLRYSYVELALLDVKKAVPAIREALRAGRLPKRSWLLFHDSALEAEWIGIWDDSPPPPELPV